MVIRLNEIKVELHSIPAVSFHSAGSDEKVVRGVLGAGQGKLQYIPVRSSLNYRYSTRSKMMYQTSFGLDRCMGNQTQFMPNSLNMRKSPLKRSGLRKDRSTAVLLLEHAVQLCSKHLLSQTSAAHAWRSFSSINSAHGDSYTVKCWDICVPTSTWGIACHIHTGHCATSCPIQGSRNMIEGGQERVKTRWEHCCETESSGHKYLLQSKNSQQL